MEVFVGHYKCLVAMDVCVAWDRWLVTLVFVGSYKWLVTMDMCVVWYRWLVTMEVFVGSYKWLVTMDVYGVVQVTGNYGGVCR